MVTCPKCRKPNPPDAAFCGFCGASLPQPKSAATPAGGAAQHKTVFGYNIDPSVMKGMMQTASAKPPAVESTIDSEGTARANAEHMEEGPTLQDVKKPKTTNLDGKSEKLQSDPVKPVVGGANNPSGVQVADQPIGASLIAGRYQLLELLDSSATGKTYRAQDTKQGLDIALLVVDNAVFPSPLDMERARRELRQLQKVECPAILKILDHGKTEDGRLYIAMEHANEPTLDAIITSQGPMDLATAQKLIKEIGTGLAEAQKVGVIHRDIAPHNILIVDQDTIKLRGFAIAAPVRNHIFGTPEFISPEQATGRPIDQRSNIYNLGALLFFMLTGEPPFQANSPEEFLEKHIKEEPVSPATRKPGLDLSARADALILKALAKSSSRRHLTLRQFLREVEAMDEKGSKEASDISALSSPASLVTPLHGVTALTSGTKPPPSSELPRITFSMEQSIASNDAAGEQQTLDPSNNTANGTVTEPPLPSNNKLSSGTTPPAEGRVSQRTGELSSAVSLKQASPTTLAHPEGGSSKPATNPPIIPSAPAGANVNEQTAPAPGDNKKPAGFRETMWFFKGEVESAIAETGTEAAGPPAEIEATPNELAVKYSDDGSMSEDEARKFSLRTGKTQMMQQARIPVGALPGKKMAAEEFISEINHGRKFAIFIGAGIGVALIIGLIIWLIAK